MAPRRTIRSSPRRGPPRAPALLLLLLLLLTLWGPSLGAQAFPTPRLPVAAGDGDGPGLTRGDWWFGGLASIDGLRLGHGNARSSGLETDRLAILAEHTGGWQFALETDLDGEETPRNLRSAWFGGGDPERLAWRVGQFAVGPTSEAASPHGVLPFVGRGFAAHLAGVTDSGLAVERGDTAWLGLTATAGHGFGLRGHRRAGPRYGLRAGWQPLAEAAGDPGPYLALGLAEARDLDDPVELAQPLGQTVFTTPDLDGRSSRTLALELGWAGERWLLAYESAQTRLDGVALPGGGRRDFDQLGSFTLSAAAYLRGRAPAWVRGRWQRRAPALDGPDGDAERPLFLALRYSNADIDRDLFDVGLASFDPSTQEVRSASVAVGGWWDDRTRLVLQWVKTIADHELGTFSGRNRDSSWVLRVTRWF